MPSNSLPGFLLDPYGRPATYTGGALGGTGTSGAYGTLYRRTSEDDRLRPRPPNHFADYLALLSPLRYRELVSECRARASYGLVPALLDQRADYVSASGYAPHFTGHDTEFGAELLAALTESLKICNLRGTRYTWRDTWRMGGTLRATDGSYWVNLTEWGDTGWPAIQILEGHRVGSRNTYATLVGSDDALTILVAEDGTRTEARGVYRGLSIINGIIYNEAGTEIAYRVLGATPADDEDISARDLIHVARPDRPSEGRPAPDLAGPLMNFQGADMAQTSALDVQITDARQTFVETNAAGRYDPAAAFKPTPTGGTPAGTPTDIEERGSRTFIKTGMTLTPLQTARPSFQWQEFDQRVNSRAAAELGWRLEMLDPTALRGAATRAFQDQINTTIFSQFSIDAEPALRVLRYFAAKLAGPKVRAIRNHPELRSLGVSTPPWFEVDRASARIDLEEVAAGRVSMSTLRRRDGTSDAEVMTARANNYELALKIQAQHPDVPLNIILGDLGITATRTGQFDTNPDPNAPDLPPGKSP